MHIRPLSTILLIFALVLPVCSAEKPIIGVTVNYGARESGSEFVSLSSGTIDAVEAAGGVPVLLPPIRDKADFARFLELADGFVFTGGSDLNPAVYGREKHEKTKLLHPRREEFDLAFMRAVLDSGKPVLGICLGMQEMNVACGGTLIQDIPSETDSKLIHRGEGSGHDVEIVPDTLLHRLLGGDKFAVNSSHHQSVDDPGEALVITARAPDGIIEGIEVKEHPFAIGVQWHPESMTDEEPQLNLFNSLVKVAKGESLEEAVGELEIIESPIATTTYSKWDGERAIDTVVVHYASAIFWFNDGSVIARASEETKAYVEEIGLTPENLAEHKYDWQLVKAIFEAYSVSAHYAIARDGTIVRFVADNDRAWHAGRGSMPNDGRKGVNDFSIGIELMASHPDDDPTVKTKEDAYTEAQYESLNKLIALLCKNHGIENVVGHDEIAPGRKTDPGPLFQWERVRNENYWPLACGSEPTAEEKAAAAEAEKPKGLYAELEATAPYNNPPGKWDHLPERMETRYDTAKALFREGKHEEAMDLFLWAYDRGLLDTPSYSGVRNSFMLRDMAKLAEKYPPMKAAMRRRQVHAAEKLLSGEISYRLASDVSKLSDKLDDIEFSASIYRELRNRGTDSNTLRIGFNDDKLITHFVENGEFKLCRELIGDPMQQMQKKIRRYERSLETSQRSPEIAKMYEERSYRKFIDSSKELYEIALATGKVGEAESILGEVERAKEMNLEIRKEFASIRTNYTAVSSALTH